ncbi:MAG: hypothetical protein GY861_12355 [bacterium]|nr:hypothetical protein [bacterium]
MTKFKLTTFLVMFAVILVVLINGCASPQEVPQEKPPEVPKEEPQSPLEKLLSEEINYSLYSENGFSVLYPQWPDTTEGNVELTVSKGYCTVAINSEMIPAKQWYDMFVESINNQVGELIISDKDNLRLKFSSDIQDVTLVSENRIYMCNGRSTAVTLSCIDEVDEVMQKISDTIFPSANCEEEEIIFTEFQDEDFSIDHPDWEETTDSSEARVLGKTTGVCSIIVDKHNALPKDIINWLGKTIEEKEDHTLLSLSTDENDYNIAYRFIFAEEYTITATTKVFYCNYQSYLTQVLCVDEYATDRDKETRDSILNSAKCAKEYEIPTPEKIEKEREEVEEKEPEVIEEIEDEIVKTNAGEEFGIDEELVVYFINSNEFFSRIMKDFPKANLLIKDNDTGRELKLRVLVNSEGKITLLEDGEYDVVDVTLIIPLRDAVNIFSNAENINPLNLLGFAVNVRTEPVEIKNQIIQKVLRGEYA